MSEEFISTIDEFYTRIENSNLTIESIVEKIKKTKITN